MGLLGENAEKVIAGDTHAATKATRKKVLRLFLPNKKNKWGQTPFITGGFPSSKKWGRTKIIENKKACCRQAGV